jgi:tRNA threonylcarbamoyladenosine biosynthesis protein TsaB
MITLALETASAYATIALADDEGLCAEVCLRSAHDLSTRLMVEVDHLLRESALTAKELSLVAVSRGPGGFTSLRLGVATAKAIAYAEGLPIVGVSSLEVAAYPLRWRTSALICPVFLSAREDLFAAVYRAEEGECRLLVEECMLTGSELVAKLNQHDGEVIFTGAAVDLPKAWLTAGLERPWAFVPAPFCYPRAAAVALRGRALFEERGGDNPLTLAPTYLRASQAEMAERASSDA